MSSEIIVGIDFGTTHSGVSWAVNGGERFIRLIDTWPNPKASNTGKDKVPSVISYLDGSPDKWGYNVGFKDEAFKWIKILLEPDHKYAKTVEPVLASNKLLVSLNKTAVEVVADYLRFLWKYALTDIRNRNGDDFESVYKLKIVLTVPAMWTPAAKDRTLQAAKEAGLPGDIMLVTEPEAAALATLKDKANIDNLKVGDAFVVCDAGGGTVDLISYQVMKLNPLEIKECAIGEGGLCGSVFIDTAFEKHVKDVVGDYQYSRLKDSAKQKMMWEFEYQVKREFTGDSAQPYSVELKGVDDDPPHISDDTIIVKGAVVRDVFDGVCGDIEGLIRRQISHVSDKGLPIKAILLVGGFGDSPYLFMRLKAKFKQEKSIPVLQVTRAWSSICRGATMWGLENSTHYENSSRTVTSRLARYSYGLAFSVPYDPSKHLTQDRVKDDSTGEWRAKGQMEWLLKRGEEITEGKVLSTQCYRSLPAVAITYGLLTFGDMESDQNLYYSDAAVAPTRLNEYVKPLCTVHWSISWYKLNLKPAYEHPETKDQWRDCEFALAMVLGNAALDYFVVHNEQVAGYAEAKYVEEF